MTRALPSSSPTKESERMHTSIHRKHIADVTMDISMVEPGMETPLLPLYQAQVWIQAELPVLWIQAHIQDNVQV